jgi:hypothetical protein
MWAITPFGVPANAEQDTIIYTMQKQIRVILEYHSDKHPKLLLDTQRLLNLVIAMCMLSLSTSTISMYEYATSTLFTGWPNSRPCSPDLAKRVANSIKLEIENGVYKFLVDVAAGGHVTFVCRALPDVAEELLEPCGDGIESPLDSNYVWVGEDAGVAGVCGRFARAFLAAAFRVLSLGKTEEEGPVAPVSILAGEFEDDTNIVKGIDRVDSGVAGLGAVGVESLGV